MVASLMRDEVQNECHRSIESAICGHHVYRSNWTPEIDN